MNTVNQTFDWSRFTATLRKELVENKRAILFTLLGTYGLLTMIMIFGNLSVGSNGSVREMTEIIQNFYLPQKFVFLILSTAAVIAASLAFRKLTNKSGRIEMFTSPSSTLEKFLVNSLIYVIGYIVAFFICAQLADLTRIAVLRLFAGENFIVPGPVNFLHLIPDAVNGFGFGSDIPGDANKWFSINFYLGMLAGPGLFLLGSIVWPRLSLLKTFAAVYGVQTILGIILVIVVMNINDMESAGWWIINHMEHIAIATLVITVLEIILFWGLSWYLFKRKDVISLKWWK